MFNFVNKYWYLNITCRLSAIVLCSSTWKHVRPLSSSVCSGVLQLTENRLLRLIQLQIRFIFMIFIRQTVEDKLLFSICLCLLNRWVDEVLSHSHGLSLCEVAEVEQQRPRQCPDRRRNAQHSWNSLVLRQWESDSVLFTGADDVMRSKLSVSFQDV